MSIDVACPNCHSRLKAPDGMVGKKARCKKCQESFRIPGGDPHASDGGDAQQLSVVGDSPFAFPGDAPAPSPAKPVEPKADPPSKSKYRTKAAVPAKKSSYGGGKAAPVGGKSRLPLFALAGLLCAGGGAAVFFAYSESQKPKDTPAPAVAATTPPNNPPAVPPPVPVKDDKSKKAKADPVAAKVNAEPKAGPRVLKATGGLKLPPPNPKPTSLEKAVASIPLDHPPTAAKQLLVGGSEGPVMLVTRRTFDGLGGKGMKDTIDRYALNTFRLIDQTEVPADTVKSYPRVCDVSPAGDRFAYEHPAGKLTVTQLGVKTNVVEGLDLAGASDPVGIVGLHFLTQDQLAVVTKAGVVEVWDLDAKKKVSATEPLPAGASLVPGRSCTFRVDYDPKNVLEKSALFAYAGGVVYQVPLAGKPRAVFTLPRKPTACLALAVESGGERIAVAYTATEPGEHTRFVYGRLSDPEPKGDLSLDAEAGTPVAANWNRPETFTVLTDKGQGFACDADNGNIIAAFRPEKPSPLMVVEGVNHWFLLPDPADAKKAVLVNVTIPPESYSPSLTGAKWTTLSLTINPAGTAK